MRVYEAVNSMPDDAGHVVVLGAGVGTERSSVRALTTLPLFDGQHQDVNVIFSGGNKNWMNTATTCAMRASEASSMSICVLNAVSEIEFNKIPIEKRSDYEVLKQFYDTIFALEPKIFLENVSRNTQENFVNTRQYLGNVAADEAVVLVTDSSHMPRALRYAEAIWPNNMSLRPVVAEYQPTLVEQAHELVARAITPYRLRTATTNE